ncbi:hypothetical protein QZH45_09460 [Pseudomonas corrugata]|uniref:hypothetical protein n=1 Tax=Pseudomonas corrugata TaxID=47879 RepID=UPI003D812816
MTANKERPILFSAPMVRAILEDRKTVTRRACKPQPSANAHTTSAEGKPMGAWWETGKDVNRCPYGKPGDRLWVREAWVADAQVDAIAPRDLSQGEPIRYPADGAVRQTGCSMLTPGKGRPSIHMPRWASRILLEITAVRIERLQDISDAQIEREGIDLDALTDGQDRYDMCHAGSGVEGRPTLRTAWHDLWVSTGGDWDANPWVWVVEFKRVQP